MKTFKITLQDSVYTVKAKSQASALQLVKKHHSSVNDESSDVSYKGATIVVTECMIDGFGETFKSIDAAKKQIDSDIKNGIKY